MQLPLQIVQVGEDRVNRSEKTRDISSGGVCFLSGYGVDPGTRIEYLITLSGNNPPVKIRCLGKVLRSDPSPSEPDWFETAVTMERYQFVKSEELEAVAAGF
jgi:hypothetical protein